MKRMILLLMISLFFLPVIKSGICLICWSICLFNRLSCLGCMNRFCPVSACFSSDTIFYKLEDGQVKKVLVHELKKNDLVISNNENKITKVVRNVKDKGIFNYIQIILESGEELKVTDEHGVIVIEDESNRRVLKANNLREGQKLITFEGPKAIKTINNLNLKDKYILETLDGTVIANGIYISTICENMINEKIDADDLIKDWKNKHERLFNGLINN